MKSLSRLCDTGSYGLPGAGWSCHTIGLLFPEIFKSLGIHVSQELVEGENQLSTSALHIDLLNVCLL
jgi:hypothetical protein